MTAPFPGMDPYLEGHLWPDVHQRLSTEIADLLTPQIAPRYVARLGIYTVTDDRPGEEAGIMYPDVAVFEQKAEEPPTIYHQAPRFTPTTVTLPVLQTVEVRIPRLEIRDRDHNRLITAIEVLSPVNKRPPGAAPYRAKRERLHQKGVHVLEIDLLRRGERSIIHRRLPTSHYLVALTRAQPSQIQCWAIDLREALPIVPVPLQASEPDVALDLGLALQQVYQKARYDVSIDYLQAPPPPALMPEEMDWVREQVKQ